MNKFKNPKTIIFDLDGTLGDITQRRKARITWVVVRLIGISFLTHQMCPYKYVSNYHCKLSKNKVSKFLFLVVD